VDVIVELRRYSPEDHDDTRRVLSGWGRFEGTPTELVIDRQADGYHVLGSRTNVRQGDELETILDVLTTGGAGMTWEEVKEAWPTTTKPGTTRLRGLLNQGVQEGRWQRSGMGVRNDPWRYRAKPQESDSIRSAHHRGNRIEKEGV
jgi:hypothetical protein